MADIDTNVEKETLQIRLKPFPGLAFPSPKHAWPSWSPHTLGCAIDSGNGPRGLIGYLLSPAAYLARFGDAFVAREAPVDPGVGAARDAQIAHINAMAEYNKEHRVMKLFRNKLINCLDHDVTISVGTGEQLMTMSPRDIYTRLETLLERFPLLNSTTS